MGNAMTILTWALTYPPPPCPLRRLCLLLHQAYVPHLLRQAENVNLRALWFVEAHRWYSGGSRCSKMINLISVKTGRTAKAKVVNGCDSINGCDTEHAYQLPCQNNIVDGSDAVWSALGLDKNVGEEDVEENFY
ncbi:hypothetical protein NL676_020877 [Syzygium grande]|nr:hypothetical protein NL676_020877 [Syzygium grande]